MKTIIFCDTLLTPFQLLKDHSIVIEAGVISSLTPGKVKPTDGDHTIDASHMLVTPGLIDVHVHGALDFDVNDANEEANIAISRFYAVHGVTSYCATPYSGSMENLINSIQAVTKTRWPEDGARQIGLHIEGPFLSAKYRGAQPENALRDATIDEIKRWMEVGQIKLITLAPERPGAMEAIRFCAQNGIVPVVGHSEAAYEQVIAAADAGLSHATHTFNGMTGVHHRNPGVTGAVLTDDRIFAEIIADGIHLHPAIVKLVIRAKTPERTVLITDAVRAAGMADGVSDLGGQRLIIKDGAPYTESGSLAGSMLSLDTAVRNVMSFTGLPFEAVLPMATTTPAASLGMQSEIGALQPGAYADIVFWDRDYQVRQTIVSGKTVFKG
jgi:N-acetylglucosamine-6-phosphate deacetylase